MRTAKGRGMTKNRMLSREKGNRLAGREGTKTC